MIQRSIPLSKIRTLITKLSDLSYQYDKETHTITYTLEDEEIYQLRLPYQLDENLEVRNYDYVICLIQTENASVGMVKDHQIIDHKTFSTYAVRKKQGKSQIKYLKTRGKSKAGSRLRLANTINFFEHINERLQQYFKDHEVKKVMFSCSKILIPYLFTSKVACPFDKKDERIHKIPKYIPNANFEDLTQTFKNLQKGEFIFSEASKEDAEILLQSVFDN
ncbi:hypothetical protein [Flammeovirga pacifica]|uniref:VLRF1 domain-containing protein n=1 Tax=Flammeovirga pacifica TaxID=915059 RepID=A0A1S1YTM1_FLAPC|nr:hypothetical protein [Flammeovirga pacifica]OHX64384.1 hypothetical protein NH26_22590 [Flammeovirga pacifica]